MELSSILSTESIRLTNSATSKKRLFQDLGETAAAACGLDMNLAVEALMERESLGPTGVGHGIALPHARIPDLDKVCAVFLKLEKPLDFDSVDRQPVDLVFALFAPVDAGVDHLKALALVSRTMRNAGTCAKLRANDDAATLHAILTEVETNQAA